MKIEDWPSAKTIPALYRELKSLDLLEHLAELDAFGFTVLPPEKVGPPEQHAAVRETVLRVACERKGCKEDQLADVFSDGQELLRFVLWDDPIFEKLVLTPAALGLIQWLVGTDCILSLCNAWIKGKGSARTNIHADWAQFDMPTMAVEAYGANFNYVLTDYSKADGGLTFVPGSHRWRRLPSTEEAAYWADNAHAVDAPAGSMVIWGDHTWHGSYPKETEGLRLMVLGMYNRPHMQTQEAYRETVTDEALARNPLRFARLMNVYHGMPWGKSGSDYKRMGSAPRGYISLFDTEPAGDKVSTRPAYDYGNYDRAIGDAVKTSMSAKAVSFPDHYKGAKPLASREKRR
jgi:ectoine hydroxylase-related dioxygenase (phytanoyl-CoA dioxygenase family)